MLRPAACSGAAAISREVPELPVPLANTALGAKDRVQSQGPLLKQSIVHAPRTTSLASVASHTRVYLKSHTTMMAPSHHQPYLLV